MKFSPNLGEGRRLKVYENRVLKNTFRSKEEEVERREGISRGYYTHLALHLLLLR
jgi:hypothetical protein